jgi:ABC-type phosphate/phosphonate transport system permease subunit
MRSNLTVTLILALLLGLVLNEVGFFEYRRLASVLLLILAIVLVMDGISAWIRKRFLLATA